MKWIIGCVVIAIILWTVFRSNRKTLNPQDFPLHPDDENLVRDEDIEWFSNLSFSDLQAFEKGDNTCKGASYLKHREEGLSEEAAAAKTRQFWPYYYGSLNTRSNDKWQGEDALLPYHIKDRVNRAAAAKKFERVQLEDSTTMNALIRKLIRSESI